MILKSVFFYSSTVIIAKNLLGKFLVSKKDAFLITEVEAYDGPNDKASHASRGQTPRNAIMFGPPGFFYVYLVYGMHWMLNIVTGPKNYPAAILIRGAGEYSGPARLTKALGIDGHFNGKKVAKNTGLWIEDRGILIAQTQIAQTPRIGVDYAGPVWSQKPYRFLLKNGDTNIYRKSIRSSTKNSAWKSFNI